MFKSNFKLNPLFELGLRPSSFSLTAKNCLSFSAVEVSGCHFSAPALKCSKQDPGRVPTALLPQLLDDGIHHSYDGMRDHLTAKPIQRTLISFRDCYDLHPIVAESDLLRD